MKEDAIIERTSAGPVDRTSSGPGGLERALVDRFDAEHRTTMRVLRAFPASRGAFRPHERSATALEIVATLVREQCGVLSVLDGTWSMPPSFPAPPESWSAAVAAMEAVGPRVTAALERTPASRLDESVPFFVGPRQVAPMPVRELLWFWLLDSVHHRGQLSVYLRLAGGRVPAIYGPSADEPWT